MGEMAKKRYKAKKPAMKIFEVQQTAAIIK